jgi:hypothetical protein
MTFEELEATPAGYYLALVQGAWQNTPEWTVVQIAHERVSWINAMGTDQGWGPEEIHLLLSRIKLPDESSSRVGHRPALDDVL